jgi:hypothetical protein
MKRLLAFTAVIEAATGLALMAVPTVAVRLLFGGEISGASIPLGRVAGLSLLARISHTPIEKGRPSVA